MRDWLMVRVREPPWYLAVGMEKYIRNILFFFFLLLLSPLSRTLGTRVTYQRSVNDRKTIEIGWILFGPREGYFGGARLNRVSRDLRGCLSVSTKIGLTPHSLHHRGEKPRDTYPPSSLRQRKDERSLAENAPPLRAVAALPSDRAFSKFGFARISLDRNDECM